VLTQATSNSGGFGKFGEKTGCSAYALKTFEIKPVIDLAKLKPISLQVSPVSTVCP